MGEGESFDSNALLLVPQQRPLYIHGTCRRPAPHVLVLVANRMLFPMITLFATILNSIFTMQRSSYHCCIKFSEVSSEMTSLTTGDFARYAEKALAPIGQVLPLPDNLSFEEGAAIPEVSLVAGMLNYLFVNHRCLTMK